MISFMFEHVKPNVSLCLSQFLDFVYLSIVRASLLQGKNDSLYKKMVIIIRKSIKNWTNHDDIFHVWAS